MSDFEHKALDLNEKTKVVFIAMSKTMFYFRRHAVKFVLKQGFAPISQYGIFDYFLNDCVDRDLVRKANNNLLRVSDEMWVFGPVSDGVMAEIKMVKDKKPIRYFTVSKSGIEEIEKSKVKFEDGMEEFSLEM